MRHRNHSSRLNRTSEHRLALMRNLSIALIRNERIFTTLAKARQIRPFLEPLITRARKGDLSSMRLVIGRLQLKKEAGKNEEGKTIDIGPRRKLFAEIAPRTGTRPGGYLRIVKAGQRMGDGAPMAWVEFVDAAPKPDAPEQDKTKKTLKQRIHERRKEAAKARR